MYTIAEQQIDQYREFLRTEERSQGTIDKYVRDIKNFAAWLKNRELNKKSAAAWKELLIKTGLAPITINAKLAALNSYFRCVGKGESRMKYLKVQRRMFRDTTKDLSKQEYKDLVECARSQGKERLALAVSVYAPQGFG